MSTKFGRFPLLVASGRVNVARVDTIRRDFVAHTGSLCARLVPIVGKREPLSWSLRSSSPVAAAPLSVAAQSSCGSGAATKDDLKQGALWWVAIRGHTAWDRWSPAWRETGIILPAATAWCHPADLAILGAERERCGLWHISLHEADLDDTEVLPVTGADAVWCRWVFAFVRRPQPLVAKCVSSLRPGGVAVVHEYLNYATWRLLPPVRSFDEFVPVIRETWRLEGGEPDIAARLPHWLEQTGMEIESLRPYVDVVSPADAPWEWPQTFVHSSLDRLVALGRLDAERADTIRRDFMEHAASPGARLVTPIVLEVIARKR